MAGGANKKFMDQKTSFVKNNVIEVAVTDGTLMTVATLHRDPTKAVLAQVGRVANAGKAVGVTDTVKTAGIFDFDLVKSDKKAEVSVSGNLTLLPHYYLNAWGIKARDQKTVARVSRYEKPKYAHPISAYWVPWSENSAWSVQLGNQADYFFTATMDGCSLAISSGGSPLVTHGNYRSPTDPSRVSQTRTLQEMAAHHATLGTDVSKSLGKNSYASSGADKLAGINKMVTVIGFRDTVQNTWSFYYQRRKVILGDAKTGSPTRIILQKRLVPII